MASISLSYTLSF